MQGIGADIVSILDRYHSSYDRSRERGLEQQKQSRMMEIGQIAGKGDYQGAASKALAYGDLGTGSSLLQLAQGKKKEKQADHEQVVNTLYSAKDPQSWAKAISDLKASGAPIEPWEEDFNNRQRVIDSVLSIKDQREQENSDRSFGLQERNFNADETYRGQQLSLEREKLAATGTKPPQIESFFDPATGQQYKAQWNSSTNSWEKIGGNKADENGITITNPDGTTTQIGGSGGKVTEGMRRAKGFKASMKSSMENLDTTFKALTDPRNYVGDKARNIGGRRMMTPEGQMAADSFDEVVADALYIASGATLTAPEVERKKAAIIPTPNDDAKTIAAKRKRLDDLMAAVNVMAGDDPTQPNAIPSPKSTTKINGYTIEEIP